MKLPSQKLNPECARDTVVDWQPISSAPKDRTKVLLYQPDGVWRSIRRGEEISTGYWHQPANPASPGFWCSSIVANIRPTHWMPLPAPPRPEGQ